MFAAVAPITPINLHRAAGPAAVDEVEISPVNADDLIAVMSEHTRGLLQRRRGHRRSRLVRRALVLADLLGLSLAYFIATLVVSGDGILGSTKELGVFVVSLPCWVLVANLHGLYNRDEQRTEHSTTDDIVAVFHLVTVGAWLLILTSRLAGRDRPGLYGLVAFWLLSVFTVSLSRRLVRQLCRRSRAYQQNTVIVGAGDIGQLICRKLMKHPEYGANVVGFVDRTPRIRRADLPEHLAVLGGPERLGEIIRELDVERVVIAFSKESASELLALLRQLHPFDVQIDLVPWLFELIGLRVSVHSVEGLPLLGLPHGRRSTSARILKRAIDVAGAGLGLIVLSPLMAFIALRIRLDSPGPVLFRQTRLGEGMKEFTALKFRTMRIAAKSNEEPTYLSAITPDQASLEANGLFNLERADTVTGFGRWLRRTSLDELPELINVLRGDMSLVGPRPCVPDEAECLAPQHLERFLMPQGLTGLWQVTARTSSTHLETLELDTAYVRDWSLWLDLRLLLRTPLQVLRQRVSTT